MPRDSAAPNEVRFAVGPAHGWQHNARLATDHIELLVTLDVGPRILSFSALNGPNLFKVYENQLGLAGGDRWRIYGGHRLWHAPEQVPRTYSPDNDLVNHHWDGKTLRLSPARESATGLRKELEITVLPGSPSLTVLHRLINEGPWEVEVAPWALSVLAPGGVAFLPQEPFLPHGEVLLPARPLVLWPYSRMTDPRVRWGDAMIEIEQHGDGALPFKIGARNTLGWAAYALQNLLFIKRTAFDPEARYPDFESNYEIFTNGEMLELETLGPLTKLAPGGSTVEHMEEWTLLPVALAADPAARAEQLTQIIAGLGPLTITGSQR